ncbi:hypothetical protein FE810_15525 [Thalassotalea litorea]|uniref:Uncharacterized protein n=1 Tax=Thalassotalea litorea TaxID=2020715 RepID=A0A5R9IF35_9GAMM|nr:hypothetical protein [Thalassotalea litorea]TLU61230.1 hypothetical protein FE810_15525 [Thalassotalea litorea]
MSKYNFTILEQKFKKQWEQNITSEFIADTCLNKNEYENLNNGDILDRWKDSQKERSGKGSERIIEILHKRRLDELESWGEKFIEVVD